MDVQHRSLGTRGCHRRAYRRVHLESVSRMAYEKQKQWREDLASRPRIPMFFRLWGREWRV